MKYLPDYCLILTISMISAWGCKDISNSAEGDVPVKYERDTGPAGDTGTAGDTGPAGDSAGTILSCETTLLHTVPGPSEYPPLYAPAAGTESSLDSALGVLFEATDTTRNEWDVNRAPVSLTPFLEGPHPYDSGAGGMLLPPGRAGEFVTHTAIRFLLEHPEVFQLDDEFEIYQIHDSASTCSGYNNDLCLARLRQKYCGLELGADDSRYNGHVEMQVHLPTRRLWRVLSAAVPHAPVYASPKLTAAEVEAILMGLELPLNCPGGSVTVDQSATIQMSLGVFVRRSSVDANVLEYRTAYKAEVADAAFSLSWDIWVDGFDGVVLAIQANFICN